MKYSNEPVYPIVSSNNQLIDIRHSGINLREHFAGLAMQGILAANIINEQQLALGSDQVVGLALEHADALLEALVE